MIGTAVLMFIVIGVGKLEARNDEGRYCRSGELHPDFVEVRRMVDSMMSFVVRLRTYRDWMKLET